MCFVLVDKQPFVKSKQFRKKGKAAHYYVNAASEEQRLLLMHPTCKRLRVFFLDNSFNFGPINLICCRIVLLVLMEDHLHVWDVIISISGLLIIIFITL